MSKLQKYNRVVFAIISIPTLIVMCLAAFFMICEALPRSYPEYDRNNGSLSKEEAAKDAKKDEIRQYISYENMFILDNNKKELVIPVEARTMEKPERFTERFRFMESGVDEVVFDDSGVSTLSTAMTLEEKKEVVKPKKIPDTTSVKVFYATNFVNLVYENGEAGIHKTLMEKRFSGWELNYFRLGKKRFLTFLGTENDINKDGFLNEEDEGDFYFYDLDLGTMKTISIPGKKILTYNFLKNTSIVFFDVVDENRPKTRRNEQFIYRYDFNTGELKDVISDEEKKQHLKYIL